MEMLQVDNCHLESLPANVKELIASFLSIVSICRLGMVNKSWYKVIWEGGKGKVLGKPWKVIDLHEAVTRDGVNGKLITDDLLEGWFGKDETGGKLGERLRVNVEIVRLNCLKVGRRILRSIMLNCPFVKVVEMHGCPVEMRIEDFKVRIGMGVKIGCVGWKVIGRRKDKLVEKRIDGMGWLKRFGEDKFVGVYCEECGEECTGDLVRSLDKIGWNTCIVCERDWLVCSREWKRCVERCHGCLRMLCCCGGWNRKCICGVGICKECFECMDCIEERKGELDAVEEYAASWDPKGRPKGGPKGSVGKKRKRRRGDSRTVGKRVDVGEEREVRSANQKHEGEDKPTAKSPELLEYSDDMELDDFESVQLGESMVD